MIIFQGEGYDCLKGNLGGDAKWSRWDMEISIFSQFENNTTSVHTPSPFIGSVHSLYAGQCRTDDLLEFE